MFRKQHGFTLIEMLIVLMVISILIILIIPNLGGQSAKVYEKGCEALAAMVQAQVDAYFIENKEFPASIDTLVPEFITEEQKTCPNGKELQLVKDKVRIPNG